MADGEEMNSAIASSLCWALRGVTSANDTEIGPNLFAVPEELRRDHDPNIAVRTILLVFLANSSLKLHIVTQPSFIVGGPSIIVMSSSGNEMPPMETAPPVEAAHALRADSVEGERARLPKR